MIFPDYYHVAKKLGGLDPGDTIYVSKEESLFRTAINRLYYSIFRNLCLYFPEFQIKVEERQVIHQKLFHFLNGNGHINIARKLARMREKRVQADYFFKEKVVKRAFLEMIEDHDAIIEILEKLKPR
ncbi:MAG: hypothetical protein JW839_18375 [Candidatus Lokiarchaeota archaeon]|nr:hypothetical protein [Candidatus Lokiarchaeota archaeon]